MSPAARKFDWDVVVVDASGTATILAHRPRDALARLDLRVKLYVLPSPDGAPYPPDPVDDAGRARFCVSTSPKCPDTAVVE